jgi:hypothetical protein
MFRFSQLAALSADMFYMQLGASKALGGGELTWEWQNDDGAWVAYGRRDVARLEAAFQVLVVCLSVFNVYLFGVELTLKP